MRNATALLASDRDGKAGTYLARHLNRLIATKQKMIMLPDCMRRQHHSGLMKF
ncbi:MAG: hypothetical protein U5R06_01465 [candidate division KSB1 bacterium]|nr:hypothetical protein [candidate division KSB1 bacterium]